jgi:cobalamin biosynthesis protein CbiD
MAKQKKSKSGLKLGIAAAAAAAVAGAYYLTGKRGEKNRAKISSGAKKVGLQIKKTAHRLQAAQAKTYAKLAGDFDAHLEALKHVDSREFRQALRELKGHWVAIKKQLSTTKR